MVAARRDVWWADLGTPRGSEPGSRHPVLIVQSDDFNQSRLETVLTVTLTSNLRLLHAPGNVLLPAETTGLPRDSVANVSQIVALDDHYLDRQVGQLPRRLMAQVEAGLRLVLDL